METTNVNQKTILQTVLDDTFENLEQLVERQEFELITQETGVVDFIGYGIARVRGLPGVRSEELIRFPHGLMGMAFNLDADNVGVVLLGKSDKLINGMEARRTGRVLDVPVGEALLGRVIDPTGQPLDGRGIVPSNKTLPIERESHSIMDRAPVTVPLQTGIKSIDALIPIGRGQRELILGDRQTGKSAIGLDTIINQKGKDVICIYCAIGQQSSSVASFIDDLKKYDAMDYSIVVVATGEETPGLKFIAPYAATSIGEYFMEHGKDVLVIYDDLTRHSWAYRELSLLLRRPPGREAFPGDIFYLHSRLLERATRLRPELGGGSLTALPIVETEAQNVSAYIPTNLISITDGQIYLSPDLFSKGILPAVDVGKSVSRVGGKTQLPAYRTVAGDLRLYYSQFEELENFARFGTRLDPETQRTIERGRRIREVFKQYQFRPIPVAEQIVVLLAATAGYFDQIGIEELAKIELLLREALVEQHGELCQKINKGEELEKEELRTLKRFAKVFLRDRKE
ncbi:MAG: F0F1 ATP synthase subunit alpha [Chloroflexi bacterium HGW-Chloroflexi-2]|jgi:F-type H+-transporting ATPase subunit alpha|nr:MAG: F0F1 ATP synthase subunit alpha [Chloroflexi bacterium HGW-Chloroflexi-2]